jgi:branched-chain amino acid transport system substrate-binding protein
MGLEAQWASKRALKEINAAGGIDGRPLELEICDTGFDPARAVSCMKKAVRNSLVVLGPFSSMDLRASAALAAREHVMCLPVAAGAPDALKAYPWAISFAANHKLMVQSVLSWFKIYPDIKSVVVFSDTKNPMWVEWAKTCKKVCEEAGIKVLEVIEVDPGAVDVSSATVRGIGKKPDGFILSADPVQMARIILELDKRGWKKKDHIACQTAAGGESFFKVGGDKVNGVYIVSWMWDFDYPKPAWQKMISDYGKAFGGARPAAWVPFYYDAVYALKKAIKETQVTGDPAKLSEERVKIRDYMCSLKDFPSIYKPFSMGKDGWAISDICITQIRNGKPVVVSPK